MCCWPQSQHGSIRSQELLSRLNLDLWPGKPIHMSNCKVSSLLCFPNFPHTSSRASLSLVEKKIMFSTHSLGISVSAWLLYVANVRIMPQHILERKQSLSPKVSAGKWPRWQKFFLPWKDLHQPSKTFSPLETHETQNRVERSGENRRKVEGLNNSFLKMSFSMSILLTVQSFKNAKETELLLPER